MQQARESLWYGQPAIHSPRNLVQVDLNLMQPSICMPGDVPSHMEPKCFRSRWKRWQLERCGLAVSCLGLLDIEPYLRHGSAALISIAGCNELSSSTYCCIVLYCMFGPCAKAVLPLAHRHSQVGAEIHIQLLTDCGVFYMPSHLQHGTHIFNVAPTLR